MTRTTDSFWQCWNELIFSICGSEWWWPATSVPTPHPWKASPSLAGAGVAAAAGLAASVGVAAGCAAAETLLLLPPHAATGRPIALEASRMMTLFLIVLLLVVKSAAPFVGGVESAWFSGSA